MASSAQIANEKLIRETNKQLLHVHKAKEKFWKQRSIHLWLILGDSNTGFFHANTKGKKNKNTMTIIKNDEGLPYFEEEQIAEVISNFYSSLFTSK